MKQTIPLDEQYCMPGVDSYIISQISPKILVVTERVEDARRLFDEIAFYKPSLSIHLLPDWETLPYEFFSPNQELVSERLKTLWEIHQNNFDIIISPITTIIQRLPPIAYIAGHTFFFEVGQKIAYEKVKQQLLTAGYDAVKQVYRGGEFSIRGSLIDLFPMGCHEPCRLDFFDDTLEDIRSFDVETQKSTSQLKKIQILPAREIPTDEKGIQQFRQNFRLEFPGDPCRTLIYKEVSQGIFPAGIEYYLPLFYTHTACITDYLDQQTTILWHGHLDRGLQKFWETLKERHRTCNYDQQKPLLAPERLYLSATEFFNAIKPYPRLKISTDENKSSSPFKQLPRVAIIHKQQDPLAQWRDYTTSFPGKIIIVCDSVGRREALIDLFQRYHCEQPTVVDSFEKAKDHKNRLTIVTGTLYQGWCHQNTLAIITEFEIFPNTQKSTRRHHKTFNWEYWIRDLSELTIGQAVVHRQYGVGRYQGLELIDLGHGPEEFVRLHYADDDKLFVPIAELGVIARYTGLDSDKAPLHKLGNTHWDKECQKAREKVHDTAVELLEIYSQRSAKKGLSMTCSADDYQKFCDDFPFEETTDQAKAIEAVLADMASPQPMDRLVCGDVGFGKTEVALRASFVAAVSGKQVAVLCPTTLLARQHNELFSTRFAAWPLRIAELSRFRSSQEIKETIEKICSGHIDVIIGTHRLLQKDIEFPRLGLVVIDEEHRFGVRQKEIIKQWRSTIDILSLTATPIPRTLSLCLDGIRSFSVISTPPQRRLAIRTIIAPHDNAIIHEAIIRELKRGGQIYFLYNEIGRIEEIKRKLETLIPEARIAIAHGQIPNHQLERIMHDFHMQRHNILLCTTIIENGIDNPNANTIIIDRADRFGLAQLHQIRGRVGRSHHQAYAYLLIPSDEQAITGDAQKRLEAIRAADDLGAGFFLARHDLEIRGAGELLGEAQSGHVQQIGFSLFTEMLHDEVKKIRHDEEKNGDIQQTNGRVHFFQPTLIPNHYCPDVAVRLNLYKRLSDCQEFEKIDEMKEELIDRFGPLPATTERLLQLHRLRIKGQTISICEIDITEKKIIIRFSEKPIVDGHSIIATLRAIKQAKLLKNNGIAIEWSDTLTAAIQKVSDFIDLVIQNNEKQKQRQ